MYQKPIKLILVAGARPNFMKIAPLIKAINNHNNSDEKNCRIKYSLVHTGQHYDNNMSDIFFRELNIPKPDINLGVGSGSHAEQTAKIMLAFEPICLKEKPDWVIVVGDVNSTVACALVCAKLGIKLAHVEAGLRSFDRTMPEEINRLVTDALSDLLFTPSEDANENLAAEGIPPSKIRFVGNIMIDSLIEKLLLVEHSTILETHGLSPSNFIYVTLHRPTNVDNKDNLKNIMDCLQVRAVDVPVVFPVHPRTEKVLNELGFKKTHGNLNGLHLLDPIGYIDSLSLAANARLVITDSGGLQEETTYFRTPCLTLRPNTERPITIKLGSNRLTDLPNLLSDVQQFLSGPLKLGQIPPLWDGKTSERIICELTKAI